MLQKVKHKKQIELIKDFENVARKEGFYDIADFYKELQEVEEAHEERFIKLADRSEEDEMFKSIGPSLWQCMNCGYIHEGTEAPKNCPLCNYTKVLLQTLL